MTIAILAVLALLTAVEVVRLALSATDRRRPAIDGYVGHRIVLHRRGEDGALMGVLKLTAPDALVMVRVNHVTSSATTPLDGEQVIARDRVDFFQVLDGGDA